MLLCPGYCETIRSAFWCGDLLPAYPWVMRGINEVLAISWLIMSHLAKETVGDCGLIPISLWARALAEISEGKLVPIVFSCRFLPYQVRTYVHM